MGKRMGWGYYDFPEKSDIAEFFWRIESGYGSWLKQQDASQDDIVVALEDTTGTNCMEFDPNRHKLMLSQRRKEAAASSLWSRVRDYFRK
jgi:hypothetical protein